ncbi:methyltransferase domain-containing protein [Candidatus Fermentibacteria bacterium]|nr:methyltransferase domain-containing protein [Candidatus Fermentibacteria bacterium]
MPRIQPFQMYTDDYDRWFEEHYELYEAELKTLQGIIPRSLQKKLEVGVGSGRFAEPLGIRMGMDPSPKMAVKAKARGIEVCLGVAEKLPFASGRLDLLLMVTTICFVDDIVSSFREAFRVLRPRGWIAVGFVDAESDLGRKYRARRESSRFYKTATFFSAREVLDLLRQTGFRVKEVRQTLLPGMPSDTVMDGFGRGAFVVIGGMTD